MTNTSMMSKEDFLKVLMGLLEKQGIKTSVFIMKKEHGSYTGIHRVSDNDGETIAAIVNVDDSVITPRLCRSRYQIKNELMFTVMRFAFW